MYLKFNDWDNLITLLPLLKKYQAIPKDEWLALEKKVYLAILNESSNYQNSDKTNQIWAEVPKSSKIDSEILSVYLSNLINNHQDDLALSIMESTLKKQWLPQILKMYSQATSSDLIKQLSTAEKWIDSHPKDSELLLCCGILSYRNQFLGKAKNYLEQSLQISPQRSVYCELAKVCEALGNQSLAISYYRGACE